MQLPVLDHFLQINNLKRFDIFDTIRNEINKKTFLYLECKYY